MCINLENVCHLGSSGAEQSLQIQDCQKGKDGFRSEIILACRASGMGPGGVLSLLLQAKEGNGSHLVPHLMDIAEASGV